MLEEEEEIGTLKDTLEHILSATTVEGVVKEVKQYFNCTRISSTPKIRKKAGAFVEVVCFYILSQEQEAMDGEYEF